LSSSPGFFLSFFSTFLLPFCFAGSSIKTLYVITKKKE
jgi:hypothetical protein